MKPWYQKFIVDGKSTTRVGFMDDGYYSKISLLFPPSVEGKKVLDLGCNAGFVSFKLSDLGATVTGVDKDKDYIEQANFISGRTDTNVEFVLADMMDLDTPDLQPYDMILALSCLYHLKEPLKMIKRLCCTEALLIASFRTSNYDQYIDYFKKLGKKVAMTSSYGKKIAVRFE